MMQWMTAFLAGWISLAGFTEEQKTPGYLLQTTELEKLEEAYAFDVTDRIQDRDLYLIDVDGISVLEAMQKDPRVDLLSYNEQITVAETDIASLSSPFDWQEEMMDLGLVREQSRDREDPVIIAVVDTGIYPHASIEDQLLEPIVIASGYTPLPTSHGSLMARIIAEGNDAAMILPVQVLDENGSGATFDFVMGMNEALSRDVDVFNMSLAASQESLIMELVMDAAEEAGIPVIAAAGNSGGDGLAYPARYPSTLSVGGLTEERFRADYSQFGEGLDVMAPGTAATSTWETRGTSIATAFVSRGMALLASRHESIALPAQVNTLKATALPFRNKAEYGLGLVQFQQASDAMNKATVLNEAGSFLDDPLTRSKCDPVTIEFSQRVDGRTVNDGVSAYNALGLPVQMEVEVSGKELLLTFDEPGRGYYLHVNTSLKDRLGQSLTEDTYQEVTITPCEDN